jgi:hypothetical protein
MTNELLNVRLADVRLTFTCKACQCSTTLSIERWKIPDQCYVCAELWADALAHDKVFVAVRNAGGLAILKYLAERDAERPAAMPQVPMPFVLRLEVPAPE